jgi:hypothetical protein
MSEDVGPIAAEIKREEKRLRTRLLDRQRAFKKVFSLDGSASQVKAVKLVLEDLSRFCRADRSCFDHDPRIHAALEGRREVFLRIGEHVDLTQKELWNRYQLGE